MPQQAEKTERPTTPQITGFWSGYWAYKAIVAQLKKEREEEAQPTIIEKPRVAYDPLKHAKEVLAALLNLKQYLNRIKWYLESRRNKYFITSFLIMGNSRHFNLFRNY